MERLTRRTNGVVVYIGAKNPYSTGQIPCEVDPAGVREMMVRLAAYEDTGLMPNDVTDMMAANGNAICEIVKLKEELQGAKNAVEQYAAINETLFDSNMKLGADRKALIDELCQYCGKYKQAHEGACDGCRWREM